MLDLLSGEPPSKAAVARLDIREKPDGEVFVEGACEVRTENGEVFVEGACEVRTDGSSEVCKQISFRVKGLGIRDKDLGITFIL